jgi:hypothetical protein
MLFAKKVLVNLNVWKVSCLANVHFAEKLSKQICFNVNQNRARTKQSKEAYTSVLQAIIK